MGRLKIIDVFKTLKGCYKNIDFRGAYYKVGDKWEYIISFIRFSRKTIKEIKEMHDELKEQDIISEHFKIEYKILSVDDFEVRWQEIKSSAERTLQSIRDKEMESDINSINRTHFNRYLSEQDKKEYNSIFFTVEFFDKNIQHHERFKFLYKELMKKGEKDIYQVIKKSLQIENFNLNAPVYCVILFPIYLKIDPTSMRFINNYLTVDIIFHDFFENSEVFFQINDLSNNFFQKEKFIVTSDREKVRHFRFKKLKEGFSKIQYTIYFGKINILDLNKNKMRLTTRFSYSDIDEFLIDFEIPLEIIYHDIEGKEKITETLFYLIKPFLEIDLLNRENRKEKANIIIEDFLQNKIEQIVKTIRENAEWLINPVSIHSLREFFISAANRPDSEYHNFFIELIIKSCYKAINEDLLDEGDIISRINDLLIVYNIHSQYSVKFYYYRNSLARVRDEIRYIFEEIFENYPQCGEISKFERRSRFNFDYPTLWSECRGNYNETIYFHLYFIRNDYSKFNYHNVHLLIWTPNDWNLVSPTDLNKITTFFKKLFKIPNMHVADNKFLPKQILSKLKDVPYIKLYPTQQELLSLQQQFRVINSQGDSQEKKYFDFNILIGKNNSGKTMALTMLYHQINSYRTFDREDNINNFKKNYPEFPEFEMFYIPHHRKLSDSIGKSLNIYKSLVDFFGTLTNLRSHAYLKDEPVVIENRLKEKKDDYWIIPNFIEIIDIFSFKIDQEHSLNQTDQLIVEHGVQLIQTFNEVFKNWCNVVKEFFPDIQIERLKSIDREGNQCVLIKDLYSEREITNWKSLGSGTQQLLNLIFLIEYLKIGPLVDIRGLLDAIKRGEIENAFKNYMIFTYNNRILFIDEPEVSLHPSLQRAFFEYLAESSRRLQIFVATHSPFFLDIPDFVNLLGKKIAVTLYIKSDTGEFKSMPINLYNKLKIIDEIFEFNPKETAFYLSKNDYSDLLITNRERGFNLLQLGMINNMVRNKFSPNYLDLLKLGTSNEDINPRLIQNAHFLTFEPKTIDLTENIGTIEDWEQIFIYQVNISKFKSKNIKHQFEGVCISCWSKKAVKEMVLTYTESQAKDLGARILKTLQSYQTSEINKIIRNKSIIIFPENSIPYSFLNDLIKFAIKNKIIIIGGMEDRKLSEIEKLIKELSQIFPNKNVQATDYLTLRSYPSFDEDVYINQAIIINSNGCFSFQIKNIPVYFNRSGKKENIPIILNPTYFKFKTSIGDIAVFICKDFLVNYSVIDKWMVKNNISLIAVPSFTELTNPFRNKFGEIINLRRNIDKTFIFANIAEFGGSGIYNFNRKRDYEPGKVSVFRSGEEKCEAFIRKEIIT